MSKVQYRSKQKKQKERITGDSCSSSKKASLRQALSLSAEATDA